MNLTCDQVTVTQKGYIAIATSDCPLDTTCFWKAQNDQEACPWFRMLVGKTIRCAYTPEEATRED